MLSVRQVPAFRQPAATAEARSEVELHAQFREARRDFGCGNQPRAVRDEGLVVAQDGLGVEQVVDVTPTLALALPNLRIFPNRTSTSLTRSPYNTPGTTRLTVA